MRLETLNARVIRCRRCPRLVEWRERVARVKKAAFHDCEYWAKPVPGFGDPRARVVAIGLAPGAHGSNRTGRMFTGDASGTFLYRALYETGFADRPHSERRGDGLTLTNLYITAAVRCAPPKNKPAPEELAHCASYLDEELALLDRTRVVVALGRVAFDAYFAHLKRRRFIVRPRPKFRHGACWKTPEDRWLVASYHPSRQNTNTGKLTQSQLQAIFEEAARLSRV